MSIKLSKQHGVNPSLLVCPLCKKEYAIALFGRLKGDTEAPRYTQGELCDECAKTHIEIREVISETDKTLTGRGCLIPREALNITINGNIAIMAKEQFEKLFINGKKDGD